MNCFSLLLTFILVFFQVKQCYCLKKESLGFDTILSNPLESHANSKAIDSKGYLDTETIAPVSLSNEAKSRRRRYVAFPEGSSFSVAFCATVGFVGNPQYIYFSWALNWGLGYDLPNDTWIIEQKNRRRFHPKPLEQRRHRRDLFERLETAIDAMGYNGRACTLRALCESSQYFGKRRNMVEEMIRTIFSLPVMKVLPFEHSDLMIYDKAFRKGRNKEQCLTAYPDCDFSLIELALGHYADASYFV